MSHTAGMAIKYPVPVRGRGHTESSRSGRIGGWIRKYVFHLRVLQALKSALAAGIAWALAVLIPGVAEQYPYYAPLGALAVVSPTVTATIKQGLQSMMGLAVGILLAWFAVWVGTPNSFTIAFVVGAGVLVAAVLPRMGGGAYGIPSAALFVLVLGGQNTSFSFGYFIQMIVGVGVGLAVSMLVLPELNVNDAVRQMGGLRRAVAHQLQDIGEAMREEWAPDDKRWAERREDLILTLSAPVVRSNSPTRAGKAITYAWCFGEI